MQLHQPNDLLDWFRWRRRYGKDTTIHLKGDERSGKSSMAVHLQASLEPRWKVQDSLFYDWTDLGPLLQAAFTRFNELEALPPEHQAAAKVAWWPFFWGDEATNILDVLDFNKQENKAVKKLFRQWGILGALTILVDPDGRLDRYVMKHRAKVQIVMREYVYPEDCPSGMSPQDCLTGMIRLQRRDPNLEQDPWYEDQFEWTFPKPHIRWPEHWRAYTAPKLASVGLRLGETHQVFQDAAANRMRNRLKVHADIKKFQAIVDND